MKTHTLDNLIEQLQKIQAGFFKTFGITDIITNSKIFEILIADSLGHELIPGHSGSRDAKDSDKNEYEYKHFKESSSNHTWTFNDYSDTTIEKLTAAKAVIFAHIDDKSEGFPSFDWYYEVPGDVISIYLKNATASIQNTRKMINVSPRQIEREMKLKKQTAENSKGIYTEWLERLINTIKEIEQIVDTKDILTSNKFWEVLVALKLGHKVQSEQAKHDATDKNGNTYEYKVSKTSSWSFQDISEDVLKKYLENKSIILAIVDKENISVKKIYEASSEDIVKKLKEKLQKKEVKYKKENKEIRRTQVNLSSGDLKNINANLLYEA